MTGTGRGGPAGVRVFEALTGREVLDRISKTFDDLMAKLVALPEFNHPVTFPEVDFRVKVSLTTWPLEDTSLEFVKADHVTAFDIQTLEPMERATSPIEREVEEGFATGALEQVERPDGSVRVNSAPDDIRAEIGADTPVLTRVKSGELVTHVDAESVRDEPVEVNGPDVAQRDPRVSQVAGDMVRDEPHPPINPYTGRPGRGVRLDRGGPQTVRPLVGE